MLFSAQPFSSCPFSAICSEIQVSYNGEYLGFTMNICRDSSNSLSIQREISYNLIVT